MIYTHTTEISQSPIRLLSPIQVPPVWFLGTKGVTIKTPCIDSTTFNFSTPRVYNPNASYRDSEDLVNPTQAEFLTARIFMSGLMH